MDYNNFNFAQQQAQRSSLSKEQEHRAMAVKPGTRQHIMAPF
jgi:hypothetical protein